VRAAEGIFERHAAKYDAWFDSPHGRLLFESEVKCISPLLAPQQRPWAEVGVGTGRFAEALGVDVGVDPAYGALTMAANRGIQVARARGEALPFRSGQFGAALVVVTLCFASRPLALLRECGRILSENGRAVLGIVPANSPWGEFYARRAKRGHLFYSVARFYTLGEVKRLAAEAGLTLERARSTLFQPPGPGGLAVEEPQKGSHQGAGFVALAFRSA
jgi:SAM-dependent methyltransferase